MTLLRGTSAALVLGADLLLAPAAPLAEDEGRPPVESGMIEHVEVQLVLLDVLVLDRRDRTVPALARDDFELYVDGDPVELVSLDADCGAGRLRDVRPGDSPAAARRGGRAAAPRRIVHAFDYYHITNAAETLEQARRAIRRLSGASDEQMLVSIGPGLRVEQPFSDDPERLDRELARMNQDRGLYAGPLGRLTEYRFYQRLESLMDFLELVEGPKVVVLYSGPFQPDGFDHDPEFRRIAALAARARVALYPVDSGGLRTPLSYPHGDRMATELARLAVETGGRATYNTNDLSLGLARAQRDLGCRYTLGFRDTSGRRDRARAVRVWLRKPGLRLVYPVFYVIRSREALLEDRVRTAGLVPEMFDAGGMRVEARGLRPRGPGSWEVQVAVELPEALRADMGADAWQLEGVVRSPSGAVERRFRREIAPGGAAEEPPPPLVERLRVDPGAYQVGVVLHRPGLDAPLAAESRLALPPIPREDVFLVGPHVGRSAAGAADSTPEGDFELLGPQGVRRGGAIEALTWICRIGRGEPARARVGRDLTAESGETVGTFDAAVVELGGTGGLDCRALVDPIATGALAPGRYAVRAYLEAAGPPAEAAFAVTP